MPQSGVIEGAKNTSVHPVQAAHRQLFRVAGFRQCPRRRDELMGQHHVPPGGVHLQIFNDGSQRIRVILDFNIREKAPHHGRPQEGNEVDVHLAPPILQGVVPDGSVVYRRDPNAAPLHQLMPEGHPLRRIVVSADQEHRDVLRRHGGEKIVHQTHRLCRRDGFVVHVAGNQQTVRLLLLHDFQNPIQNVFLILHHGKPVYPFSQVEVRQVHQLHSSNSFPSPPERSGSDCCTPDAPPGYEFHAYCFEVPGRRNRAR